MTELKSCPMCSGKAKRHHNKQFRTWYVACKGCGLSTIDYCSKKDARKAWNRRVKE